MNELETLGVKVELVKPFSVVRESLDRIGIKNSTKKILNPSCYLLHKKGEYFIIHFKQLLALDGKETNFSDDDLKRTVSIAFLLDNWGLVDIVDVDALDDISTVYISVLPYNEKEEYQIKHKYRIGSKK